MIATRSAPLLLALSVLVAVPQAAWANHRQKRIVGGAPAAPPPVDDPLVFVRKDDREAIVFGTRDAKTGYYLFRGIRYAEPPVGNRRFQRSVPLYLEGRVNATKWGAPCPQPGKNGAVIGSEDCLFLNVFTPALPDATEGYPVLIWIHGGNFRQGAATQYEMRNLIEKKTIVVSIQYRLGSLGFLSTGTKDLSGNNGLFDMILATEWVRDYIEFFGGNPKKIVAFGHGSGASSAFMLGLSKFGNSYFSGIVAMSGSVLSRFAVDKEPHKATKEMALNNNCSTNDTVVMVRCLRELPASKLVEQDTKHESLTKKAKNFITDLSTLLNPGPVVEGKNDLRSLPNFVTDEPEDSLNLDDLPEIPLLTGVIKDETGGAVKGPYKDTITRTLQIIPDFFAKQLVPQLQTIVPSVGNVTKQFIPEAFSKYLDVFGSGSKKTIDTLSKVSEALNDAIFNAPAFLTAKNWSKKSKAFLYSFDHKSKKGFGKDFLDGLPLVGNSAETGITSHGDDLGYVFEPNSIMGEAIPKAMDEEDEKVKDMFTEIIANFARSGDVQVKSKSNDGSSSPISLPSFTNSDEGDFLSITSDPKVSKQFRFCEMGLWTGIEERYSSSLCSAFFVDIKDPLKTIQKSIDVVSNVPMLSKVTDVSNFLNVDEKLLESPIKLPDITNVPGLPASIPKIPDAISNPIPNGKLPDLPSNPLSGASVSKNLPTYKNPLPGASTVPKNLPSYTNPLPTPPKVKLPSIFG